MATLFPLLNKKNEDETDFLTPSLKNFLTIAATYLTAKNNSQAGQVDYDFIVAIRVFFDHIFSLVNETARVEVETTSRRIFAYFTTFYLPPHWEVSVDEELRTNILRLNQLLINQEALNL
jgi:hypothetical protein